MNRVQLVQVIVIIVAIMLGYQMLNSFILFLGQTLVPLIVNEKVSYTYTFSYGFFALLFAIGMFLIINYAPKITAWITDKVQLDENIDLSFSDKNVIYAVLLFTAGNALLKNIPAILYQVFELFKNEAGGSRSFSSPIAVTNYPQWIETIFDFILLFKAKAVVDYLHRKIDPEDPHAIETEAEEEPIEIQ